VRGTLRYAAYGSNLHPLRLRKRAPSASLVASALVPNWGLRFHKQSNDGSGKCNIVSADRSVFFAVFDIDSRDKLALDEIEGLNFGYEEKTIVIPEFGECFSYVASQSHIDDKLHPYSWYKALVIAGLEYHKAPPDYLANVQSVDHIVDEDNARHAMNMAIVSKARNST